MALKDIGSSQLLAVVFVGGVRGEDEAALGAKKVLRICFCWGLLRQKPFPSCGSLGSDGPFRQYSCVKKLMLGVSVKKRS